MTAKALLAGRPEALGVGAAAAEPVKACGVVWGFGAFLPTFFAGKKPDR